MRQEDVIAELNALDPTDDNEEAHYDADALLLDFLRALGYSAVASAYEAARKRVGFAYY
jgi:hypothetical protein